MRRFKAWLTPGTVLGSIALIVALGGTGYAASSAKHHPKHHPTHTLSSSDVRRIAADEIRKAAPRLSVGHASTASTADTASTANSAKIATNVFSANVRPDGSLLGSIPAGGSSSKAFLGDYRVSFGRSIAGCTIAATLAGVNVQLGMIGVGVIDANTLQVFTRDETNTVADRGFYIQAICPG